MVDVELFLSNSKKIEEIKKKEINALEAENYKIVKKAISKLEAFEGDFLYRLGCAEFSVDFNYSELTIEISLGETDYYSNFRAFFKAIVPFQDINEVNTLEDIKKYAVFTEKGFWESFSKNESEAIIKKYENAKFEDVMVIYVGNFHAKVKYCPEGKFIINRLGVAMNVNNKEEILDFMSEEKYNTL